MWAICPISAGRGRQAGKITGRKHEQRDVTCMSRSSPKQVRSSACAGTWSRVTSRLASYRESAISDGGQNQLRFLLLLSHQGSRLHEGGDILDGYRVLWLRPGAARTGPAQLAHPFDVLLVSEGHG